MKKLLIVTCLVLASCSHTEQKMRFDFAFDNTKSNIGNGVGINVRVYDNRLEPSFIGTKEYCDNEKVNISNDQNVVDLFRKKFNKSLSDKGFKTGNNKQVEIFIERLKYKSECGFVGKSNASLLIKVAVTNGQGGKIIKNFERSYSGKHFIIPLVSTDEKIINELLDNAVNDILNDDVLLRN